MHSPLIVAADALVSVLNDRDTKTFAIEFAAERSYADWDIEPGDFHLHVDVVPVGYAKGDDLASRGDIRYRPMLDIGIRKRFGTDEQTQDGRIVLAEIDALLGLLDEVHEYLLTRDLTGSNDEQFEWFDTEFRASFVRLGLDENRTYIGIIRVTYDYMKEME